MALRCCCAATARRSPDAPCTNAYSARSTCAATRSCRAAPWPWASLVRSARARSPSARTLSSPRASWDAPGNTGRGGSRRRRRPGAFTPRSSRQQRIPNPSAPRRQSSSRAPRAGAASPARASVELSHRRTGLLGELRRRVAVDLEHQALKLLAGNRGDLEFRLLGLRQKILVSHRVREGLAQRRDTILGHVGRRRERTAHHLAAEDELEDGALLVGLREIHDQGHVQEIGMLTQRVLHQQADLFLFYPPPAGRLHGRPRNAAASLRFATLHREINFVTSRIAGYHLELGAEHVVEQRGILIRIVGHSAGAD